MNFRIICPTAAETQKLGENISPHLVPGDILGLVGDLGAGKTTFTQGLARGLGVPDDVYVNSPTFTIINEYPTTPMLYHLDFYRLIDMDELFEIGFEDLTTAGGICVIEWFDHLPKAAPETYLRLDIDEEGKGRVFTFTAFGNDWAERLPMIENALKGEG